MTAGFSTRDPRRASWWLAVLLALAFAAPGCAEEAATPTAGPAASPDLGPMPPLVPLGSRKKKRKKRRRRRKHKKSRRAAKKSSPAAKSAAAAVPPTPQASAPVVAAAPTAPPKPPPRKLSAAAAAALGSDDLFASEERPEEAAERAAKAAAQKRDKPLWEQSESELGLAKPRTRGGDPLLDARKRRPKAPPPKASQRAALKPAKMQIDQGDTLTQKEVIAGVQPKLGALRRCISQKVGHRNDLRGRLWLEFAVGNDGRARAVEVSHPELDRTDPATRGLQRCMRGVLKNASWRSFKGQVRVVRYPFDLL